MSKKKVKKPPKDSLPRYSRWNQANDPPVKIIETYLEAKRGGWAHDSAKVFAERIYKFYRWLEFQNVAVSDISLDILESYNCTMRHKGLTEKSITQYRRTINVFIRWLSRNNKLGESLVDLSLEKIKFPLLQRHLEELTQPHAIKIHKIYVHEFYTFLKARKIVISKIIKNDILEYEKQLRIQVPPRPTPARMINMRCVRSHIHWLAHEGHLESSLGELGVGKIKHQAFIEVDLPEIAKDFLRLALAHRKPRTVCGYKSKLKHFYKFLTDRQISVTKFTRRDFENYTKTFHDRGYSPVSTNHAISAVQIYLSWLYECGHLGHDPEPIIGNFPRPRRPDKLPRYLYPEVDKVIQDTLKKTDDVIAQALYLMRRTGIRIGDLRDLKFDCLSQDERGYSFMKVPLGKLDKERLFPLDKESLRVLKKIKKMSRKSNGNSEPETLIIHPRGRPPGDADYYYLLHEISEKIRIDKQLSLGDEDLVSHRLRHTFATTLVNAGIELEALRDLLGHRSLSMTLVYAKVAPKKLRADYLEALNKIEQGIKLPDLPQPATEGELNQLLEEITIRLKAKSLAGSPSQERRINSLIRRVGRMKADLATIK
jgi:site-specific recombinase XerD